MDWSLDHTLASAFLFTSRKIAFKIVHHIFSPIITRAMLTVYYFYLPHQKIQKLLNNF